MSDRITEAVERTRELHVPEIPLRSVYQIGGTLEGGGEGEGEGRSLHVDIDVVSPCGRARGRCAIIATEAQFASPRLLPESVVDQACEAVARELGVLENLELEAARAAARAASGQYEQLLDALGLVAVSAAGDRTLPTPEAAIARALDLVAELREARRDRRRLAALQSGADAMANAVARETLTHDGDLADRIERAGIERLSFAVAALERTLANTHDAAAEHEAQVRAAASDQYERVLDALGLITVGPGGERTLATPEAAIARARHLVATAAEVDGVVERIQRMIDRTEIGAPP